MRSLINWFRSWLGASQANRSMLSLEKRIRHLQKTKERSGLDLNVQKEKLILIVEKFEHQLKMTNMAVENAETLNKQLSAELEATHEALKVANEIVIPGLVTANQTFRDAWDSQSSMLVMRSVASKESVT